MNLSPTLRVGTSLIIAGNMLNIASNAVQPPISDYTDTIEVFTALLATPLWDVSRVGVLLAAMFGAGGLMLLVCAFHQQAGESLFTLATANALLGVPVIAVMMGLDLAQRQLAKQILSLADEPASTALWAGQALHNTSFAVFTLSLILASTTPVLLGSALLIGRRHPRWIGWSALVGGSAILLAAFFQALYGPTPWVINVLVPVFGIVVTVANLAFGAQIWRAGQ